MLKTSFGNYTRNSISSIVEQTRNEWMNIPLNVTYFNSFNSGISKL